MPSNSTLSDVANICCLIFIFSHPFHGGWLFSLHSDTFHRAGKGLLGVCVCANLLFLFNISITEAKCDASAENYVSAIHSEFFKNEGFGCEVLECEV